MRKTDGNYTILVNWKKRGFSCSRSCSYCSWSGSPLLPRGGQSADSVSAFVTKCRKSHVTISGGGDPLFGFDEYGPQLRGMIDVIKGHGKKVRIISRELQHIQKLRGFVNYVSVSLDPEVLDNIASFAPAWTGMDVEYSLVLPPLPTAEIVRLKPQYAQLQRRLGRRLVLRENLMSIFPLDFGQLTFGHTGIVFVPKTLCLAGEYLATSEFHGRDIIQDGEAVASYLMGEARIHLFGGFVKHLVNPRIHPEFDDIDVIATDPAVMKELAARFAYSFRDVSASPTSYPKYFIGTSTRTGKAIQVVLMSSDSDATRFVKSAQYDADRVSFSAGVFHFDEAVGEEVICHAINSKRVREVEGARDRSLFNNSRPLVEQRHKIKLLRKGFTIIEQRP